MTTARRTARIGGLTAGLLVLAMAAGGPVAEAETPAPAPGDAATTAPAEPPSSDATPSRRPLPVLPPLPPTPKIVPKFPPLPRIESRPDGLYVAGSGERFVSRGANYVRLDRNKAGEVYHSTFEPGRFDFSRITAFLDQMEHDGYNTVRVFIDHGSGGGDHGIGRGIGTHDKVYGPYMNNFVRFVLAAAARGIYTMPSVDGFPVNSYYWDLVGREGGGNPQNMDGRNLSYMERGRVAAKAEYMKNFATAVEELIGARYTTSILAYQSDNEVFFESHKAPFHKKSGTVTPFNGVTYDMADPGQRQQAADASLAEYTIRVDRALAEADPDALHAIGFFSYQAVEKNGPDGFAKNCEANCSGNFQYPGRAGILSHWGAVDLLDIHMYQHNGKPVLDALEMQHRKDPYVVGEFGAFKEAYGNDLTRAAGAMRDLQREACRLGSQGYLYFTWDTTEPLASLDKFFHMTERNGAINGVIAPIVRPDPCR